MDDVERIAAKLTKAQRRLILALDPVVYRDWKALSVNVRTRNRLAELGLVRFGVVRPVTTYSMRRLSPLGAAVRQYLMEQDNGERRNKIRCSNVRLLKGRPRRS